MYRLERLWRVAGTGVGFAAFGLGGIAMATALFPPVIWLSRGPLARKRRIQFLIQTSFRIFIRALCFFRIIELHVSGRPLLANARGLLVVSNHPSLLDVVILMSMLPRVQCVVKHQIWANPFLRPVVAGAGYIRNDLDPEALVERCADALRSGDNVIIFPEGTRSVEGQAMVVKRGFANVAFAARTDLCLTTINCAPVFLPKGRAWYDVPRIRPVFHVEVGERLDISAFLGYPFRSQAVRRLATFVRQYYVEKCEHGRPGIRTEDADRHDAQARRSFA